MDTKQDTDHLDHPASHDPNDLADALKASEAAIATTGEHEETVREAFRNHTMAVFWAIVMSLTIVMEGYDTILISSLFAYPSFVRTYGSYYPELGTYSISSAWQVGVGQAANCGAIIGLIINGVVTERYGHRRVTMAGLVVMSGFIFLTFFAPSIQVLCVGQVLVGIPWGIFAIMGSAYSSEVCPLALRGYLTSFVNICWVIGQLIAAGVLQGLVSNTTRWAFRIPFAIQWAWPLPLLVLAWLAPDSPWWLVRHGRLDEAARSQRRLSPGLTDLQIQQRIALMVRTNRYEEALHMESSYRDCFRGTNLRRTEIASMILSSQTLVGQALAYSPTYFFTQAGLKTSDAYKLSFGDSGIAFVATCLSWILMTYFGRRTLVLTGLTLLTIDLLVIGLLSYSPSHGAALWAQSGLALLWLGIYSSFLGPESFTLAAEISATRLRSQTISIARNAYNVANIVDGVIETYLINPTAANLKAKTALFWFGISFLTTVWAFLRLPETRGRTYGELDVLFARKIPAWRFAKTPVDATAEDEKVEAT